MLCTLWRNLLIMGCSKAISTWQGDIAHYLIIGRLKAGAYLMRTGLREPGTLSPLNRVKRISQPHPKEDHPKLQRCQAIPPMPQKHWGVVKGIRLSYHNGYIGLRGTILGTHTVSSFTTKSIKLTSPDHGVGSSE